MGSGRPDSLLLASSISSLISSPYVLLAAAAVVVIAVLIVLIMVLRGGSKKTQLASEYDDDQGAWESEPRKAVSQSNREHDQQDQVFPWQGGDARAEGGRQPAGGGRRGAAEWGAQGDWEQADGGHAQRAGQWDAPGQPASPGGQWGGEPAMGRNGAGDQRAPQGQVSSRDSEWGWGGAQASSGGQNEWGRGPAASPAKGSDQDGWGQPSSGRGRGQDQWGQGGPSQGQEQDGWGQPSAARPQQGGWGQPAQNDWGQASPSRPQGQEGWGQPSPSRPRDQDGWGQPTPSHPRDQGQWGQPSQPARPAQPGPSRPISQGGVGGQPSAGDAGSEWGQPRFERPAAQAHQQAGGWEQREPASWQAPKQEEPPPWQGAGWNPVEPEPPAARGGQRSQSASSPQWGQAGRSAAQDGWETPGAANDWNQPAQAPKPAPSRPVGPGGAPGGVQSSPSGNADENWSQSNFGGPTVRPMQQQPAGGWESREAPPWSPAQEAAPPVWQAPSAAPTSGPVGGASAPAGRGADMRPMSRVSPDATAYSAPAPVGEEVEAAKTVVVRRDAGVERIPAIVVRQGKEPGRTYEMRKEHISIGRSRESDIFLEDLAVSRLHATIYRDEMGGYRLRDEHSANGTSLNGQRVSESVLQEGDEIQLGQTILAFMRR